MKSSMHTKKIGLYGGTFDPVHFGHLNLAIEMLENCKLEEIWFCPARLNPHKQANVPSVDIYHRLQMLRLALKDVPHCRVLDIEAKREGPSFTIDTLRELIAIEEMSDTPRQICLIIGDDAVPGFFQWNKPEEIVSIAPVFIGRRGTRAIEPLKGNPVICEALEKGSIHTHVMEISSTEIRERLANGLYCGHLMPAKVLDYIYQNRLYSNP